MNEKNGNVQTNSLRKRIKIAAINGIIGRMDKTYIICGLRCIYWCNYWLGYWNGSFIDAVYLCQIIMR